MSEEDRLSLLIVEDEVLVSHVYAEYLAADFQVDEAHTVSEAEKCIQKNPYNIILLDIGLGNERNAGFELLTHIRKTSPDAHVVMLSGRDDTETIKSALNSGALDFVSKGQKDQDILNRIGTLAHEIRSRKSSNHAVFCNAGREIITEDERFLTILGNLHFLRDNTNITILIQGESGVGKELVARYIHGLGDPSRPFVVVNCATIRETLVESHLFGHTKGSFTGAHEDRIGKFELAHGGDIFLDEIGTLPEDMQLRFLRVLQEGEVERVGSAHTKNIQCRVIAATNVDLQKLIEKGRFRLDLYHRLKGMEFTIPPLRERPKDIDLLIDHFSCGARLKIPEEVRKILRAYTWPGNVRELENYIKLMVAMKSGGILTLRDVPKEFYQDRSTDDFANENLGKELYLKARAKGLKPVLEEVEKIILTYALEDSRDQVSCAELLKTSAPTITRKIKEYGLRRIS